jgi:hypothetical protein
MSHPYTAYEGTPLWRAVDAALADLEDNEDLELRAERRLVVGYLCEALVDAGLASSTPGDAPSA